jgi:hypothetical protein
VAVFVEAFAERGHITRGGIGRPVSNPALISSDVRYGSLADMAAFSRHVGLTSKAVIEATQTDVRFVPCVDGSELARTFFTFAALVGAAMCSAC